MGSLLGTNLHHRRRARHICERRNRICPGGARHLTHLRHQHCGDCDDKRSHPDPQRLLHDDNVSSAPRPLAETRGSSASRPPLPIPPSHSRKATPPTVAPKARERAPGQPSWQKPHGHRPALPAGCRGTAYRTLEAPCQDRPLPRKSHTAGAVGSSSTERRYFMQMPALARQKLSSMWALTLYPPVSTTLMVTPAAFAAR